MKKDKKSFGEFVIKLGQVERNALMLLCAKWDMSPSQVVTLAVDAFYRRKLNAHEKADLGDDLYCNHVIGELVNANRGEWGYDAELNDIPDDKKHLLIDMEYDSME